MSEILDRARLEQILALQTGAPQAVDLPSLGVKVWVRPLDGTAQMRIGAYVAGIKNFQGMSRDDLRDLDEEVTGDMAARAMVATVRYALVDEDGEVLCRSFAEAARLLAALDIEDLSALQGVLRPMTDGIGGVEEGKGS